MDTTKIEKAVVDEFKRNFELYAHEGAKRVMDAAIDTAMKKIEKNLRVRLIPKLGGTFGVEIIWVKSPFEDDPHQDETPNGTI